MKNFIELSEEPFISFQGEVPAGHITYFIRTKGCINNCKHCDTKFSWNNNKSIIKYDLNDFYLKVLTDIEKYNRVEEIDITGGEPLLWIEELTKVLFYLENNLTSRFNYNNTKFSIETSGNIIRRPRIDTLREFIKFINSFNISPKTPCLEPKTEKNHVFLYDFVHLILEAEKNINLKFVVRDEDDIKDVNFTLGNLNLTYPFPKNFNIYLMPFTDNLKTKKTNQDILHYVSKVCLEKGWRISPRLHLDYNFK